MPRANVTHNLDQVMFTLSRLQLWPKLAGEIVDRHMYSIEQAAKGLAPVDTGHMRDNIRKLGTLISQDLVKGEVISAAHYSSYVEYGTMYLPVGGQHPQPFVNPAVQAEIDKLVQDLVIGFNELFL